MSKKEVSLSNEERLSSLRGQFEEVVEKRDKLMSDLNTLNTFGLKLQGAIEILEAMNDEKKEEKKSD